MNIIPIVVGKSPFPYYLTILFTLSVFTSLFNHPRFILNSLSICSVMSLDLSLLLLLSNPESVISIVVTSYLKRVFCDCIALWIIEAIVSLYLLWVALII